MMKFRKRFLPYVVAIGSTAIALLLVLSLEPFLLRTIGAFFYIAIIVSSWYGGWRPGSVAVVLSTVAINYWFIPPRYQFWFERPEDLVQLTIFFLVAFLINLLTSNFRDSKQKIERLSQQLAQENAQQLRMALSAAQMGMWDRNMVTGEINWSPEHEQLFGLTPGTFDGKYETVEACLHPDDREKLNQAVERSLKQRVPYQNEYRVVWADGSIHWIEARGQAFYDEAGQPVRMTGTAMAIDKRKQAQTALQEREAILRLFAQYAPAGIAMFDRDMRYLMASQRWVDEYNLDSIESLMNRSHYEIFPEIPERWRQIHQRCLAGAIEKCDEDLFVRSDGTEQWISWKIHPWYTATNEIGGIIIFSVDITQRKQVEIALGESQIRLQRKLAEIETIYQSAPIGLSVVDTEFRFVRINQRLAEINGLPVEAHIGRTVREVVPDLADEAEQLLRPILETGKPLLNVEINGETPAQPGVQRIWLENFFPLKDGDRIIGISIVCEEITSRKQAEMALVQLNAELEQRVQERTAELSGVNHHLLETVMEQQHTQLILLEQAQLLDLAHDTIMTRDLHSVITFWNEGAEQMYGWKKAEALGQESHTFLQTQFPAPLAEIESELRERGYWEGELIHTRKDGSTVTVASRWVMQKDEMGRPIKVMEINNDITVQKQVEAALRESEERRRLALDLTHTGFWDLHLLSGKNIWNDNYFTLLGLAPNDIEPSYELWRSRIHPDDIGWVEQRFLESIENHADYTNEYRVIHPDGSVHWVMGRGKAIYDELGQPVRSLGVLLDISDRKRAEETLQQYERIISNTKDGIALMNRHYIYQVANQSYLSWCNKSAREVIGNSVRNILGHELFDNFIQPRLDRCLAGENIQYERWFDYPNLVPQFLSVTYTPYRDASENIAGVIVSLRDLTQLKQAEQMLELQAVITRNMAEGICLARADNGVIVYANPKFEQMFGYDSGELNGQHVSIVNYPSDGVTPEDVNQAICSAVLQSGESTYEVHNVKKNGTPFWCSATTSVFRHPDYGDVLVAVHQDITVAKHLEEVRQRTEEALRQSEAKFRSLSESSPVGIFMMDIQGQCTYTNPRYQVISGCTLDEALGDGWVQFIHPEEREEFAAKWLKAVSQGQEFSGEIRYLHKDRTLRFGRVRSAPIFSVADEVIGYVGTVEDVTDNRAVETMKNEFISIVSHELRTPLTSIRGSLGLVAAGVFKNKPEAAQQMLNIAVHDTERLVRLVNDILDLERLESHKVNLVKQWCDAATLLQQSVETVQSLATEGNITLCVESVSVQVWVDCDRILQTLVNLVSNAIKFSPPEATITLSVQDQADRVLFQVKDQGRGIPTDKIDTIFGRFQQVDASDSRQKGGTGLGLAICKSIVQQHGGNIWVESVVGEGSSFYFTVPKSLD